MNLFPKLSTDVVLGEAVMVRIRLPGANHQAAGDLSLLTIDRMTLKALVEKGSDDDLLRGR